jgi:ankyrin repeat protein
MNLEQLRKQAKELVRAVRDGDPAARARLGDLPVRLASAQLVIARENGQPSWSALVHTAEATVASFVAAATSGRRERADRLLAARPEIASDPWARLVLGRGFDGDASRAGGPLGWVPLLYAAHSCYAPADVLRALLADGADPNATFANEFGEMSALYGAAGVVADPTMTGLLLEAGADPNDGESVYHAAEADDPACLRLLLEFGARPAGTNALGSAIDGDRLEHVRLLLEGGADPNEGRGAPVVHAVRRGCGPEMVRLLAAFGADLDRTGGEWSTPRRQFRTAYQNAVLRGRDDVAAVLAELGASTDVADDDRRLAALCRGDKGVGRLGPHALETPDAQEVLVLAALGGRLETIVDAVGPDFRGHCGGGPAGNLLHHAAWVGAPEVVRRLLERGADPVARSGAEFDAPVAWAALGSWAHRLDGRDYVAVTESLVEAGAVLEPRFADVAEGPLAAWLEERL